MNRRKWLFLFLAVLFTLVVTAGCPRQGEKQPPPGDGERQELDISALVTQWVESPHSNILLYPATREQGGCVQCHDGGAFAQGAESPADLERDFNVAIDCRACHTGRGQELMQAGEVTIPTLENFSGGTGAQCLACHNERRAPVANDPERSAPHPSSQAGVYTASGGIRAEGFNYGSTTAHVTVENTCNRCHMVQAEQGFSSHTFRVDNVGAACGQCHQNIQDVNLQAKNDYDGNGEKQGFQDEVEGLLNVLQSAITEELEGGSFEAGGGRIVFKDAAGAETQVPDEVYQAAYNHTLVTQDGSLGIHNPQFVVQLLQQSYRALTGEDVPGAEKR